MKTTLNIVLFIIIFLESRNIYTQNGWFALNSGTTLQIRDIQFLDANIGYLIYGEQINPPFTSYVRKSVNGGISWSTILTVSGPLNRMYFLDVNTGTVVGGLGNIRRTTNGGVTWISQTNPTGSGPLQGVKFINSNTGFIAGNSRTILFTTDGGTTWINRPHGSNQGIWYDVSFFNANTGVVVGVATTGQPIIRTTDAGLSWNSVTPLIASSYFRVSFSDNNTGFCIGTGSAYALAKTTNNGNNWIGVNSTGSFVFRGLSVIDTINVVVVGDDGKIFRSGNSGLNWLQQPSGTTKSLYGVSFINPNTGWACGDTGTLVKTTTGGITPIQPISNILPKSFSLYQNYPNPFNPVTKIKFDLPKAAFITVKIYDLLGREVTELVNEELNPGTYEVDWDASVYSSGMYFYEIKTETYRDVKKMILVK